MKLDLNKLNENTIYLSNFFDDIENDMIYKDNDVLHINIRGEVFGEYIDNMNDLGFEYTNNIARCFKRRMCETILAYYNQFADENLTIVKLI